MSPHSRNRPPPALLSLLLIASLSPTLSFELPHPIAFGLVRFVSPHSDYEEFLNEIGRPTFDASSGAPNGYNLISLDGFKATSTYGSIETALSPLNIWKSIFEIIMGLKVSPRGRSSAELQKSIIEHQFHKNGSKLLMNVDLTDGPISSQQVDAVTLGREVVASAQALNLDGVSLEFKDYHAVKDNTASDWLEKLLKSIRSSAADNFVVVLITPSTFPPSMRLFKSPLTNSYVDLFVLQYYDTIKADYTSFETTFQRADFYQGTSLFELLVDPEIQLDICRTLIAKPASPTRLSNQGQYTAASSLSSQLMQAYNSKGWFGGLANLDFSISTTNFITDSLSVLRNACIQSEKCVC